MGKRSDFDRLERDYYKTPYAAFAPLIPFLPKHRFTYAEPCAGNHCLIDHITKGTNGNAVCNYAGDLDPDAEGIIQKNALFINEFDIGECDIIITNPPWDRSKKHNYILHNMIEHFVSMRPTWLLFDSDWVQTQQSTPYMKYLVATVSVGRVKWFPETNMTGKDNCQWHLFHKDAREINDAPEMFGRGMKPYEWFVQKYFGAADGVRIAA